VKTDKMNINEGKMSKLLDSQFSHKISIYEKSVLPTSDPFH